MSLAVPEEYKEGLENAALLHKSNKTAYIVSLIKKDLKENGEKYAELASFLKNSLVSSSLKTLSAKIKI